MTEMCITCFLWFSDIHILLWCSMSMLNIVNVPKLQASACSEHSVCYPSFPIRMTQTAVPFHSLCCQHCSMCCLHFPLAYFRSETGSNMYECIWGVSISSKEHSYYCCFLTLQKTELRTYLSYTASLCSIKRLCSDCLYTNLEILLSPKTHVETESRSDLCPNTVPFSSEWVHYSALKSYLGVSVALTPSEC